MAKKKARAAQRSEAEVSDFRYAGAERTNIPTAALAGEGAVPKIAKAKYYYSPHLSPELQFDASGHADRIQSLVKESTRRSLRQDEAELLEQATNQHQPWLEWAGKREQLAKGHFEVDTVALHIHERVSAQAIVRTALRKDVQKDLFADPQQAYSEAVQFYRHSMGWANRLILGDSLQVMTSLARREALAGQVQMVYMDPPYGIKFASNFQPQVRTREVKDRDKDLTREPETVRAYRDTWTLGVHSYLSYLRTRLLAARDLLTSSGSLFLQISDENQHLVRGLLDEVFGAENFVSLIAFQTTSGFPDTSGLSRMGDYILWYARDREALRVNTLYEEQDVAPGSQAAGWMLSPDGWYRGVNSQEEEGISPLPNGARLYLPDNLQSQGAANEPQPFEFEGKCYEPGANSHWKANYPIGMERLAAAGRVHVAANSIRYRRFSDDFALKARGNLWTDTLTGSFTERKVFTVQTNPRVIERCMLLATSPGDLVVDPTCGSGTTAYVAELWGRRWVTMDTSRVSLSIARQRLLTARLESFAIKGKTDGGHANPADGFEYKTVPHITLKSIAQNAELDAIVERYQRVLEKALDDCNRAMRCVGKELRKLLDEKLVDKVRRESKRSITAADRRRWELPANSFEHWTVPFDTDPDWPEDLQTAVNAYRAAWRDKMVEVNACIAANAPPEELVDQPVLLKGIVRVSGPFTVEGVKPEELSMGPDGLFDGTPNEFENERDGHAMPDPQNLRAYLTEMVHFMRGDGVTFLDNKTKRLARLELLQEPEAGSVIHAEGIWEGTDAAEPNHVAVSFGPQYGPVTGLQAEDAIRGSRRYSDLVIAGFSFDAEASAIIQEAVHPKLAIHQAYIRPDINPGMDGLLKDTPNSQLFTVFGQPEVVVTKGKDDEWIVALRGVDIYDPVRNEVQSTGAEKVAAWFIDGDYDGRCFCMTQAFFPDQDAWEKVAKALGSQADEEVFEAFKGTESLPFPTGKHKRIAVKVIDPRGNEVMVVHRLES